MIRFLPLIGLALVAGCATGERGLESAHQPVVDGNVASVPACPNWNHQVGGEQEAQSANFGCATNTNLAAMIADPADLLHGRAEATPAEVGNRAIKAWREVAPTSKSWVTTVKESAGGQK